MAFGTEVADAYIEVHADTKKFRRQLKGKLAKDLAKFSDQLKRTFDDDLMADQNSQWEGFRKNLAKAANSGDWSAMRRQYGSLDEMLKDVGNRLEQMRKTMVKVGEDGKTVRLIDDDHMLDILRSLEEYQKELRAKDAWAEVDASIKKNNKAWDAWSDNLGKNIDNATRDLDRVVKKSDSAAKRIADAQADYQFRIGDAIKQAHKDVWDRQFAALDREVKVIQRNQQERDRGFEQTRKQIDATERVAKKSIDSITSYQETARRKQRALERRLAQAEWDFTFKEESRNADKILREHARKIRQNGDDTTIYLLGRLKGSRNDFLNIIGSMFRPIEKGFQSMLAGGGLVGDLVNDKLIPGFKGLTSQKIVGGLKALGGSILSIGGAVAIAVLGIGMLVSLASGLGGMLTGIVSSLGMAVMALVPLAGAAVGAGYGIALMVSAIGDIKKHSPEAAAALGRLKSAFKNVDVPAFAKAWTDSFTKFVDTLATSLRDDKIAGALGRAFAGITDRFTAMLNSPSWKSFVGAMETTIPKGIEGIGRGLGAMVEGMLGMFGALGPLIQRMGEDFSTLGERFSDWIDRTIADGSLITFFDKAYESFKSVWGVVEELIGVLGTLFSMGSEQGDSWLDGWADGLERFNKWLQTDEGREKFNDWMDRAAELAKQLGEFIDDVVQFLADFDTEQASANLRDFVDIVGDLIEFTGDVGRFFDAIQRVMEVIESPANFDKWFDSTAVGQAITEIEEVITQFFTETIPQFFAETGPNLMQALVDGLIAGIDAAFPGLRETVSGWFDSFIQWVKEILGIHSPSTVFADIGRNIIEGLVEGISTAWATLTTTISTLITGLITWFSTQWETLRTNATTAWTNIKTAISTKVTEIKTAVTTKIQEVASWLATKWTEVKTTAMTKWTELKTTVTTKVTELKTAITTKVQEIASAVSTKWTEIKTATTTKWNEVKTAVSTKIQEAATAVSTKVSAILTSVSTAWTNAKTRTVTAWNEMKTTVSTKIGEVVSLVSGLPGKVLSGLGSIGTTLVNSGRNLIQGLMNGIGQMAGRVAEKARSVVSNAVSAAKRALGIASPSKVFHQIGLWSGEGLADGIEGMRNVVANTARRLAEATTEGFDPRTMFDQGRAAATGLVQGLKSNQGAVIAALGDLSPSATVNVGSRDAALAGGRTINVAEGAIQVTTASTNPETTAGIVLDDLVTHVSLGG